MFDRLYSHPLARLVALALIILAAVLGVIGISNKTSHDTTQALTRAFVKQQAATAQLLYKNTLNSCLRGLPVRRQINQTNTNAVRVNKTLIVFLHNASTTRLTAYKSTHQAFDLRAARSYLRSASQLVYLDQTRYKPVAIPDCFKVVQKP